MKKIIVSIIVIGLLLTSSIVSANAIDVEVESEHGSTFFHDDDVELLWNKSTESDRFILSAFINDDNTPDILASSYAIDGATGETIFQFEAGRAIGLGDLDNDGENEIISYIDNAHNHQENCTIYCLNASNGAILWQRVINSSWVFFVSIGNVTGDENNEVVVGVGDFGWRNNNYVYCLNGGNGSVLWRRHTDNYVRCTGIDDVNADGMNEVIACTRHATGDPRLYCLEGENGDIIWEFMPPYYTSLKTFCIGNLNDDPYKEILINMDDYNNITGGIRCLSGNDGSTVWTWRAGNVGSFQSIQIADMVPSIPGKEVIAGYFSGIFCIRGEDDPPSGGREIWYADAGSGNGIIQGIVMSTAIGDLDGDGLLDVAALMWANGGVYALNGQYGSKLWNYDGIGNSGRYSILCVDLTDDAVAEAVAISTRLDARGVYALKSNFPPGNNVPNKPTVEGPTSGEVEESYSYTTTATDPENDELYYYFDWGDGTGDISRLASSGESVSISHSWKERGIYTVKVKAIDEHGAESEWSDPLFVTIDDEPPDAPDLDGPTSGTIGEEYEYTFVATDPDDDNVSYFVDWGDDTTTGWTDFVASGTEITLTHTWDEQGTYEIKAKAKDSYGAESDWGYLEVVMPKNQQSIPQQNQQSLSQQIMTLFLHKVSANN